MKNRSLLFAAASFLFVLQSGPAAAQDLAAAEALFNKGIADMEAGKLDTACPAFKESQRIDPRPGTLFTIADCEAKAGRVATAVALYEDYLRTVSQMTTAYKLRHAERVKVATAQKTALAPQIPELTLTLPASAPKDVRIMRDGTELTAASMGIALPLDPGDHVITTQVGAGRAVEQRLILQKGEKRTVELEVKVPQNEPTPGPTTNAGAPKLPVVALAKTPAALPPSAASMGMSRQRIGALVAGGVGVVGLALGGAMGGVALSKKSVIDANCIDSVCTPEGKAAADSARTPGLLSTIGFGVGAAGVATGLVLLLTSSSPIDKSQAKMTASVLNAGPNGATVGVKGAF